MVCAPTYSAIPPAAGLRSSSFQQQLEFEMIQQVHSWEDRALMQNSNKELLLLTLACI